MEKDNPLQNKVFLLGKIGLTLHQQQPQEKNTICELKKFVTFVTTYWNTESVELFSLIESGKFSKSGGYAISYTLTGVGAVAFLTFLGHTRALST